MDDVSEAESRAFEQGAFGRMYAEKGQYEEAETYFAQALAIAEQIPQRLVRDLMMADLCGMWGDSQARWGITLEQSGNAAAARPHYDLAIRYVEQGLKVKPGYPRLMALYSRLRVL